MTTAFPLLRLPEKALTLVASCMNYTEIVLLSIVSDKIKEVVKSLNLNIEEVNIAVDDVIRILFNPTDDSPSSMMWSFHMEENNTDLEPIPVHMPARVSVASTRDLFTPENMEGYQNPGLSVQEWVHHAQYIFSIKEIRYILFENETCKFDWISLKDAIGNINVNTLFFNGLCNMECAQLALSHFPSAKCVYAFCPSFNDPSQYRNILIQNLDSLILGHVDMSLQIGLDDILLMNSKMISLESPTLTEKMMNQFLKHWIGGSNRRLEAAHFKFVNNQGVNEKLILEGLPHQGMLLEVDGENAEVYYIFRKDGTAGNISIERSDQESFVHFYVF